MKSQVPGLETKSSGLAIFLSFLCPGLGHLYLGKVVRGVAMIIATVVLYFTTYGLWSEAGRLNESWLALTVDLSDKALGDLQYQQFKHVMNYAFVSFGISLVWWVWGMVAARRSCEQFNRRVFTLATNANATASHDYGAAG